MPLDASLAGRTYPPCDPYDVALEKVSEFRSAVGDTGSDDLCAPPTFPFVIAWRGLAALLEDPDLGISLERVVHGAQRFAMTRAVRPGDVLTGAATVESVRVLGGAAVVTARVDVLDATAQQLGSAWSTLVITPTPVEGAPGEVAPVDPEPEVA